jgi:hypothetical protein
MRRDQLFEALSPAKYRKNCRIAVGTEESLIVIPSSKHPSGGMMSNARAKQ